MDSLERIITMCFLFSMTHPLWAFEAIKGIFLCIFPASLSVKCLAATDISHGHQTEQFYKFLRPDSRSLPTAFWNIAST